MFQIARPGPQTAEDLITRAAAGAASRTLAKRQNPNRNLVFRL